MDIQEKDGSLFIKYENKQYRIAGLFDCIDKAMKQMEDYTGYCFIDQVGDYAVVGYETDKGVDTI